MDLNKDIIAYLFSESRISFPGFGTLILVREGAKINPAKNKLVGEKYKTVFLYDEYYNNNIKSFVNFIKNKYKLDGKAAENAFRKYSLDLLNSFSSSDSAEISGLGTFRKQNGNFSFQLFSIINELASNAFPDYPLLLMEKPMHENAPEITSTPDLFVQEPVIKNHWKSKSFYITLFSLIFIGAILCFIFCILNLKNKESRGETISLNQDTSEIVNNLDSSVQTEVDDLSVFMDSADSEASNIVENIEDEISKQEPKTKVSKPANSYVSKDFDMNIRNSRKLKSFYSNTCIIISGSFKSKANAKKLFKKIIKNGFEPYAESHNEMYRVGSIANMDAIKPEDHLIRMQNSIEQNSWILQPKTD
jgi:nucleoid DNA-binding protein